MKKIFTVLYIGILIVYPHPSRADIDVLSAVQDKISMFQEQVNNIVKQYSGIQLNLQEISLNRDGLNALKSQTIGALKAKANEMKGNMLSHLKGKALEFLNSQMSSSSLPCITDSVDQGDYVSPTLQKAVASQYIKKKNIENDVQENIITNIRNNNLRVENVATLYANAIVNRRKLQKKLNGEEDDDDQEDAKDVPTLRDQYSKIGRRANHRWINIISLNSRYQSLLGEAYLTQDVVEDVEESLGMELENGNGSGSLGNSSSQCKSSISISEIKKMASDIEDGYQQVKKGDWTGLGNTLFDVDQR